VLSGDAEPIATLRGRAHGQLRLLFSDNSTPFEQRFRDFSSWMSVEAVTFKVVADADKSLGFVQFMSGNDDGFWATALGHTMEVKHNIAVAVSQCVPDDQVTYVPDQVTTTNGNESLHSLLKCSGNAKPPFSLAVALLRIESVQQSHAKAVDVASQFGVGVTRGLKKRTYSAESHPRPPHSSAEARIVLSSAQQRRAVDKAAGAAGAAAHGGEPPPPKECAALGWPNDADVTAAIRGVLDNAALVQPIVDADLRARVLNEMSVSVCLELLRSTTSMHPGVLVSVLLGTVVVSNRVFAQPEKWNDCETLDCKLLMYIMYSVQLQLRSLRARKQWHKLRANLARLALLLPLAAMAHGISTDGGASGLTVGVGNIEWLVEKLTRQVAGAVFKCDSQSDACFAGVYLTRAVARGEGGLRERANRAPGGSTQQKRRRVNSGESDDDCSDDHSDDNDDQSDDDQSDDDDDDGDDDGDGDAAAAAKLDAHWVEEFVDADDADVPAPRFLMISAVPWSSRFSCAMERPDVPLWSAERAGETTLRGVFGPGSFVTWSRFFNDVFIGTHRYRLVTLYRRAAAMPCLRYTPPKNSKFV
jgi:hypothetical protein